MHSTDGIGPGQVTQSVVGLTEKPEVLGWILVRPHTFVEIIRKSLLWSFSPFH